MGDTEESQINRRTKYLRAAELLRQWSKEDPEYDERVGQLLEVEFNDASLRCENHDET